MEEPLIETPAELPAEPAPRKEWDWKSGIMILVLSLMLLGCAIVVQAVALINANGGIMAFADAEQQPGMADMTIPPSLIPITIISQALAMGAPVLLIGFLMRNLNWRDFGFRRTAPMWIWIAGGAAIPLAIARITLVTGLLTLFPNLAEGLEALAELFAGGTDALSITISLLMISVLAPFYEELFFRGFLFKWMQNGMGFWLAAIFSSILFGVFHQNVPQGVSVFFLGLACAWLYEKSGSLWAAIAMHVATNLFGQALIYLLPLLGIPMQ